MRKNIVSFLLCVLLLLSFALPVYAQPGEEPAVEEIPAQAIEIASLEEFLAFAENCRLDSYSQNLQVTLAADIDLSGSGFESIPSFSGTFLGSGHTLSGLELTGAGSVQGLFRYLTATALVQDLNVTGSVLPEGSKDTVGGIAGSNAGTILNCSFVGTLSGSEAVGGIAGSNTVTGVIQDCSAEGELYGEHFIGGIVGNNAGVIRGSTNFMQVNAIPQQNSIALEQITLDTITASESTSTVTDIGGIAGHSAGVIRGCVNYGAVGYQHMGYNIGGIAGSQMGYITECVNYGAVSGRKETGGIVGQMEPVASVVFSEDTLQILKGQLDTLGALTKTASGHVQGSASSINRQLAVMQDQAAAARDAVDQLIPDEDDPTLPDMDSIQAAQNTLNSSLSGMQSSLNSISASLQGTVSSLQKDMQAISGQVEAMGQTINNASENLGGSISDISDLDTPEDLTGKVESCTNNAPVLADLNAGGIVGSIALENDLDHEEDISVIGDSSMNFIGELRAVILNCRNTATVTCGKQNAGGVVGWASMGLVKECFNSGSVEAEEADYVGGIAGQSDGFIRSCSVKSFLSGDTCVGGIAGQAGILSDCRSMTSLSGTEKLGGVVGYAETLEEITSNFYLSADADPGAVDGISYDGCAQPLDADSFLALDGLDPLFGRITVLFRFANGTIEPVILEYGQSLSDKDIPAIEEKEGYMAYWEGLHREPLHFDTEFTAVYSSRIAVIQSAETENGMPLLLAEGSFTPTSTVTVTESGDTPQLDGRRTLLAAQSFAVSDSTPPVTIRYRLPEGHDGEGIQVLLRDSDGNWLPTHSYIQDSYVVFPASAGEHHMALVQIEPFPWTSVILAALVLILIAAVIYIRKIYKKKNAPEQS